MKMNRQTVASSSRFSLNLLNGFFAAQFINHRRHIPFLYPSLLRFSFLEILDYDF